MILLHALWPSQRRFASWYLMLAAASGADWNGIRSIRAKVIPSPKPHEGFEKFKRHAVGISAGAAELLKRSSDANLKQISAHVPALTQDILADVTRLSGTSWSAPATEKAACPNATRPPK
jgi:hypothetical protein